MNAEQSNTTQARKDSESSNSYPTHSAEECFANIVRKASQTSENASETSSAKQRREEKMKKFDVEFETKMRIEQAGFGRKKLELEIQKKELETKHQLLDEERELERKVERTALENNDARSQSTGARYQSPFNWNQRRGMFQTGPAGLTTF